MVSRDLIDAALEARKQAYAPYSQFAVGAALRDERNRIHAGCNVENAAFPEGRFAETAALAAMPRHVAHLAVPSGGEPVFQSALVFLQVDAGHADGGEAEFPGARRKLGAQGGGIWQRCTMHGGDSAPSIMSG